MNLINSRKSNIDKLLLINFVVIFISFIVFLLINNDFDFLQFDNDMFAISWANNFAFIWVIYCMFKRTNNFLDYNIVFFVFLFLFCNGQVFLYSLGVDRSYLSVFLRSSDVELIKASLYFYFSVLFYNVGFLFTNVKTNANVEMVDLKFNKSIRIVSVILILISSYPFINQFLFLYNNSVRYGYGAIFETSMNVSGIVEYLSGFFVPSIFMLLFTFKNNKVVFRIILMFLITISMIYLLIGIRSIGMRVFMALLVFQNTFIKQIKFRNIFKYIPIVIIFLVLIPAIHTYRGMQNKDLDGFLESVDGAIFDSEENFAVQSIAEIGYSMHPLILTSRIIEPSKDYRYGESYIASFLMIIPSNFLGGYSFAIKANLSQWLQKTLKMTYGPGYSILAETYYNFGWYGGTIFTMFIAAFFTKIFNMSSVDNNKNQLLKLLSFIFLYASLLNARFPFASNFRNVVYMYVLIYYLVLVFYKKSGDL